MQIVAHVCYVIRTAKERLPSIQGAFVVGDRTTCSNTHSPVRPRQSTTSARQRLLLRYDLGPVCIYTPTTKQTVSYAHTHKRSGVARTDSPSHTTHSPVRTPSSLQTTRPAAISRAHALHMHARVLLENNRSTHTAARDPPRRLPSHHPRTHTRATSHHSSPAYTAHAALRAPSVSVTRATPPRHRSPRVALLAGEKLVLRGYVTCNTHISRRLHKKYAVRTILTVLPNSTFDL